MAETLTASISASINWNYTSTQTGSINTVNNNGWSFSKSLTSGTGAAGTADLIYAAQGTITASGTSNFDFAGSLTTWAGTTITMARVKYLYFAVTTDTAGSSATLGNHANPLPFVTTTATVSVRNGGILLMGCSDATGIAVGAGATDALKVVNADASVTLTYQICAIGSSA